MAVEPSKKSATTAYEKAIGRPPPESVVLTPASEAANDWYGKVQRIMAQHEDDAIAGAKAVIGAALDGQRQGHLAFTDGQHKTLTALQLAVASSSCTEESVKSLMLAFQISFVTDLDRGEKDEVTIGIDKIKEQLHDLAEFQQLRKACETTKKFTPAVSSKLIKPFAARMDEETLKVLTERCQVNREYSRNHLYNGVVTAVAQKMWSKDNNWSRGGGYAKAVQGVEANTQDGLQDVSDAAQDAKGAS